MCGSTLRDAKSATRPTRKLSSSRTCCIRITCPITPVSSETARIFGQTGIQIRPPTHRAGIVSTFTIPAARLAVATSGLGTGPYSVFQWKRRWFRSQVQCGRLPPRWAGSLQKADDTRINTHRIAAVSPGGKEPSPRCQCDGGLTSVLKTSLRWQFFLNGNDVRHCHCRLGGAGAAAGRAGTDLCISGPGQVAR